LEIVERLCTHVAIINHGEVVADGSLEELRAGVHTQADAETAASKLTLEEIFIRVIGKEDGMAAQHPEQELSWLG
jgi:ABC-2 type transport system ATP-binding protein